MMKGVHGAWRAATPHSAKNYVRQREFPFVSFCGGPLVWALELRLGARGCDRVLRVIARVNLKHLGGTPQARKPASSAIVAAMRSVTRIERRGCSSGCWSLGSSLTLPHLPVCSRYGDILPRVAGGQKRTPGGGILTLGSPPRLPSELLTALPNYARPRREREIQGNTGASRARSPSSKGFDAENCGGTAGFG